MTDRLHVFITGRVQGVGFRYAMYHEALGLGLNGWAGNLYDGRVEAEFEGPKQALEHMLDWCVDGPPLAHVTDVQAQWTSGEPRYDGFRIRS